MPDTYYYPPPSRYFEIWIWGPEGWSFNGYMYANDPQVQLLLASLELAAPGAWFMREFEAPEPPSQTFAPAYTPPFTFTPSLFAPQPDPLSAEWARL